MTDTVTHLDPPLKPECQRYEVLISTPLSVIRELPRRELIARFDELLALEHSPCQVRRLFLLGPDDYRDEPNRRAADRESRQLRMLTWILTALTALLALEALGVSVHVLD